MHFGSVWLLCVHYKDGTSSSELFDDEAEAKYAANDSWLNERDDIATIVLWHSPKPLELEQVDKWGQ